MKLTEERLVTMILEELDEIYRDPKTGKELSPDEQRTLRMKRPTGGPGTTEPGPEMSSEEEITAQARDGIKKIRMFMRMNFGSISDFPKPVKDKIIELAPELKDLIS